MKHAVVSGIVAGVSAAAVLLLAWLAVFLLVRHTAAGDPRRGVVVEGGPNGPTTTFTVTQWPTP